MAPTEENKGGNTPSGSAAPVLGNEGESHHSQGEPCQGDHSRDSSIEYPGTIERRMRKILPPLLDLTLLRLLNGKVKSLIPSLDSGSSSSSPKAWSDPWLLLELRSDGSVFSFFSSTLLCRGDHNLTN